jgi:hypothetical protein
MSGILSPFPGLAASAFTEILTDGEAVVNRAVASTAAALTSGNVQLAYFTAQKTELCSFLSTVTGGTAAGVPTFGGVGLYSVAANGNLTLLSSSGDLHATIWAGTFTEYKVALSPVVSKTAGQLYAVGALSVATTPPALVGASSAGFYFTQAPSRMAVLTGQATLPASITSGSLVGGPNFGLIIQAIVEPS